MRGNQCATRRPWVQLSIAEGEPARCPSFRRTSRRYQTCLGVGKRGLLFLGDGGQGGFDDVEAFVELSFGDTEGKEDADNVVKGTGGDRDQPVFIAELGDLFGFG